MACIAVSGKAPLNFNFDLMTVAELIWKGTKASWLLNIQENVTRLIGKCFVLHQDNDPKYPASSVKQFIRVFDRPSQSPDLNQIEHEFTR